MSKAILKSRSISRSQVPLISTLTKINYSSRRQPRWPVAVMIGERSLLRNFWEPYLELQLLKFLGLAVLISFIVGGQGAAWGRE